MNTTTWEEKMNEIRDAMAENRDALIVSQWAEIDDIAIQIEGLERDLCEWFGDERRGHGLAWASARLSDLHRELTEARERVEELEAENKDLINRVLELEGA